MPTANKAAKAVFDSGKTSSYHINSVVSCQSAKSSSSAFRIVVHRDGGNKRYEFEAESAKLASAFTFTYPPTHLSSICLSIRCIYD
jgi:target of rapamycin complex 2 subunit MAPKAP1